MKKLLSLVLSLIMCLSINVIAFADIEPTISISVKDQLSEVKVQGLAPNSFISFRAFLKVGEDEEIIDYLGQYVTDASGEITVTYLSSRIFAGGDVIRVVIGGGGLAMPVEASYTVYIPITSIRIDANVIETVERGGVYRFGLILNEGALAEDVVWTLSDPSLAIIDGDTIHILNRTGTVRLIATDPVSGLFHSITLRIAS